MPYSSEERRKELEQYFDPNSPYAAMRVAQMKRAWKQKNRRELTCGKAHTSQRLSAAYG